jgi:CubicO group peptidase (beta-lactamase class C family)
MERWLKCALDYIPDWLAFQMRASEKPGCAIAIAHRNRVVLERAWGHADLATGEPLTPRHRFRIASHTKSFTAAGILKLRERGKLKLDDLVGQFVDKLHASVARTTIAQLLSHSAGLIRDGSDAGQFLDRRPFLGTDELMAALQEPPVIEPNTRFKYSNLGYGLLGKVIEACAGDAYATWIRREIVDAADLTETEPDMPLADGIPFARGHTGRLVLGRRLTIPGDFTTNAIAPAGGFVSTAADLVCYFAQLSPKARKSVLSVASRREMVRRQWRDPHSDLERYYGLGTISGTSNGWDWFGHSGGLQGYISRTCVLPAQDLTISVLTNAVDGLAHPWLDGIIHILQAFARHGTPSRQVKDWTGRWWSLWGAIDLVPMGDKVVVAVPGTWAPFANASELAITGRSEGHIALASGSGSHGEPVRCVRRKSGKFGELWLSATRLVPEDELAAEMAARYKFSAAHGVPGRAHRRTRARSSRRHPAQG